MHFSPLSPTDRRALPESSEPLGAAPMTKAGHMVLCWCEGSVRQRRARARATLKTERRILDKTSKAGTRTDETGNRHGGATSPGRRRRKGAEEYRNRGTGRGRVQTCDGEYVRMSVDGDWFSRDGKPLRSCDAGRAGRSGAGQDRRLYPGTDRIERGKKWNWNWNWK